MNSKCFPWKNRENSQNPTKFANCTDFVNFPCFFPRETAPNSHKYPNRHANRPLFFIWFAGMTPAVSSNLLKFRKFVLLRQERVRKVRGNFADKFLQRPLPERRHSRTKNATICDPGPLYAGPLSTPSENC